MAGHRGRQARMPVGGRRPIKHTVKVMPEQEARLQSEAVAAGVSVSRLLLERALAGDGWTSTEKRAVVSELLGAVNQIARVGTNVNQIARWANTEQKFPHEAYRLVTLIEDVVAQLGAAAEAVQRP